jgi:hypothetical protein
MRFAMYNGILYAMPDEQTHNSTLQPYSSIDKTFQCVSYNLFKGDKLNSDRWEQIETNTGDKGPVYTQDYITKMKTQLEGFTNLSNNGAFTKSGIKGFYTPMAILRRGEDIVSKFLGPGVYQGAPTAVADPWVTAKKYQQLFTFEQRKGPEGSIIVPWSGTFFGSDAHIIYNLRINGDSYKIWFDYFKCMFNSYLGEDWERVAQLAKPPEWVKPDLTSSVLKERNGYYKTWKGDEEDFTPEIKDNINDDDRAHIIKLYDSENMFKYGVEKFSVDNEIHKFLKHMTDFGFDFSPKFIWWKSIDSDDNNVDWFVKSFTNQIHYKNWDRYPEYANNGNASWEIFPYQTKKDYTYHEQLGEDEQYDEGSKTLDKEGISYDNAFDEDNSGQGD